MDARFEDGDDAPLRLFVREAGDAEVLSALVQDAVFTVSDAVYRRKERRFALLINRFRHEAHRGVDAERVRSLLCFDYVDGVQFRGFDAGRGDVVLVVLAVQILDGAVRLLLSGAAEIILRCEVLEARLEDVTRPYRAVSGLRPDHGI